MHRPRHTRFLSGKLPDNLGSRKAHKNREEAVGKVIAGLQSPDVLPDVSLPSPLSSMPKHLRRCVFASSVCSAAPAVRATSEQTCGLPGTRVPGPLRHGQGWVLHECAAPDSWLPLCTQGHLHPHRTLGWMTQHTRVPCGPLHAHRFFWTFRQDCCSSPPPRQKNTPEGPSGTLKA